MRAVGSSRYNPFTFGLGKVELVNSNPTNQAVREAVQLLLAHLCSNLATDPATLEKLLAEVFAAYAYKLTLSPAWATEQTANDTNSPGETTVTAKATTSTGTGADLAILGVKLPDLIDRLWNNFSAYTADLASARQARLSHPAYPHIPLPKPLPTGVTVASLPYRELQMLSFFHQLWRGRCSALNETPSATRWFSLAWTSPLRRVH